MTKVVDFKRPAPERIQAGAARVYECGNCRYNEMKLTDLGDVYCGRCGRAQAVHWMPNPGPMA